MKTRVKDASRPSIILIHCFFNMTLFRNIQIILDLLFSIYFNQKFLKIIISIISTLLDHYERKNIATYNCNKIVN